MVNEGNFLFNSGKIQIFFSGKRQSGCYCKVYSVKTSGNRFYRDGYTDIKGTFKYAMADLDGILCFLVLTVSENSSTILELATPDRSGHIAM